MELAAGRVAGGAGPERQLARDLRRRARDRRWWRLKTRILIVADDPETVDALTVGFLFQWQEADIVAAANAREGVEAFLRHLPQLMVLDTGLPDGSSFDLLQEVRRLSTVPVILLSADDSVEDEVRGLELGADACVARPFSSLTFLARVKAVLRRAEALPPPTTPPRLRKRMASGDRGK